jgi:hypothetical protein
MGGSGTRSDSQSPPLAPPPEGQWLAIQCRGRPEATVDKPKDVHTEYTAP